MLVVCLGREGLSRKERSLITIVVLTALKPRKSLRGMCVVRSTTLVRQRKSAKPSSIVLCTPVSPAASEAFRAAQEIIEPDA